MEPVYQSFSGWQSSRDLVTKRDLGIDPGETDEARAVAHRMMRERLRSDGVPDTGFGGVLEFLSRSPSRLLAVALEDILGIADQVNVPGTVHEHPNWRRRLPIRIEQLGATFYDGLRQALGARSRLRSSNFWRHRNEGFEEVARIAGVHHPKDQDQRPGPGRLHVLE